MSQDLTIYEEGSGGDLILVNEDLSLSEGLSNQVYLALFGGNIEADTTEQQNSQEQNFDYFGNAFVGTQFNSIFERSLLRTNLNSAGVQTLINAAETDLEYLQDVAEVDVEGNIIGVNKFELIVTLTEPDNVSTQIKFVWDKQKNEVITTKELV
jgi:phage gp46-like protein